MCNPVPAQELSRQRGILGGDTQTSSFLRRVVAGQVPEISAGAHVDPGLGYSHNEPAMTIAKIALQQHNVIVAIVLTNFVITLAAMLSQDIVAGYAESGVTVLHQQRYIRGPLKDHLYMRHAANARKILARIAAVDLHATFGEKGQRCALQCSFTWKRQACFVFHFL